MILQQNIFNKAFVPGWTFNEYPAIANTFSLCASQPPPLFKMILMIEVKPKSIQTVGLLVMIFSGFIIFSNFSGALAASIIGFDLKSDDHNSDLMSVLFSHYTEICLTMIPIAILYLISGIYVRKYKLWANKLMTAISIVMILVIWATMIAVAIIINKMSELKVFALSAIFNAIVWSTPIILLIRFLNKKSIRCHFD